MHQGALPVTETREISIAAAIDVVWTVLTDLHLWPSWNESVTKIQVDGPIEAGTGFQ